MAEDIGITTDAGFSDVVEVIAKLGWVRMGKPVFNDFDKYPAYYMVTDNGGRATLAADLKRYADEYETWIAVYEQKDIGAAVRFFEALAGAINEKIVLNAPSSSEVVAQSLLGKVEWFIPREEAVVMGDYE